MATVKSKLKEILDRKINEVSKDIVKDPNDEIARARFKDLTEIKDVCIKRNRY